MILHGEQEFVYHRNAHVGDVLEGTARISDVYEKDSSSALMEFYVMETSWKDASSGDPVVDVKFTLIVRDTGVKKKEEADADGRRLRPASLRAALDVARTTSTRRCATTPCGWRTTTAGSRG